MLGLRDGGRAGSSAAPRDWLKRMRKRTKTVANEEKGNFSAVACFMENQAFRGKSRGTRSGAGRREHENPMETTMQLSTSMITIRLVAVLILAASAYAQDFRGNILGLVTDSTRAAIPDAKVIATKDDTNVSRETITNSEGIYTLVGLDPGRYTVTFTANGFTTVRRSGIVLQVADRLNLPIAMDVGQLTESVTVTGGQELVQSATASRGLVLNPTDMQEIPVSGRHVYMLMQLTPGVIFTQRQFGAAGYSFMSAWAQSNAWTMNGGRTGTNQFLLNGAPVSTEGTYNTIPNVEAVQEMKVMVNTYDAQYGRSGGGHVSSTLKSGTNNWHGSVFDYWKNRVLDANTRQNNAVGQKSGYHNLHQYGGVVGGPIRKDKDFIFFSFEGLRARMPFPSVSSVPPAQIRGGNFNFIPAGQSAPIAVYDQQTSVPCTTAGVTCVSSGVYVRQPFPGNIIPASRLSPVGQAILNLYPLPNYTTDSLTQNYVRPDNVGRYPYDMPMTRWDHIFGNNDRFSFLLTYFHGQEFRNNNGFDPPAQTGNMPGTMRKDYNYIANYDKTITPTKILHVQASFNRFIQNFPNVSDPNFTWDKLNIKNIPPVPTYPTKAPPAVSASGFAAILGSTILNESSRQQLNLQANLAQTTGRHSMKYGFEWAELMHHTRASGNASGSWTFDTVWSRRYYGQSQSALDGSGVADLLMGYMNSGNVPFNDSNFRREPYVAGYFQDDWKVSNRLTLNFGLRYDLQFPMTEIDNRLVSDFDFQSTNPISDRVLANWRQYAATTANYPAAPSVIKGGLLYAGVGGQPSRVYNYDFSNIQPRIGIAYSFLPKTVMRGGAGIFYRTLLGNPYQTGFSQTTDYINSINGGLTHRAATVGGPYSLADLFPDGLIQPVGNKNGLLTNIGTSVSFGGRQRPIPRTFQWSYTLERELPWSTVLEVSYIGSLTVKEPMSINLSDALQKDYEIAAATPNYFTQTVPNPFFGIAPTNTTLGAANVISRQNLLRRIPQFTGVSMEDNPWGRTWYHGLQVRYQKRMLGDASRSGALTWVLSYTYSKTMENALRQNQTFEWMSMINQVAVQDRTHDMTLGTVWDLPFGQNRKFMKQAGGVAQAALGNWKLNSALVYQSGVPLGAWTRWEYQCGDPLSGDRSETRWFDNRRSCFRQLGTYELTQLPARFSQIRSQTAPQLDLALSKVFIVRERYAAEFRVEAYNATNTPLRGDPNSTNPSGSDFGILPVAQLNFARQVELALRFRF
jgi:Carboxypeptidase regulatory-like domain/TonB dependent receptor